MILRHIELQRIAEKALRQVCEDGASWRIIEREESQYRDTMAYVKNQRNEKGYFI